MHGFSAELLTDSKKNQEIDVGRWGKGLVGWKKRSPWFGETLPSLTHVLYLGFPPYKASGFISITVFIFYPVVHRTSQEHLISMSPQIHSPKNKIETDYCDWLCRQPLILHFRSPPATLCSEMLSPIYSFLLFLMNTSQWEYILSVA